MNCVYCGSELYPGEQVCHVCGNVIDRMQNYQQDTQWGSDPTQIQAQGWKQPLYQNPAQQEWNQPTYQNLAQQGWVQPTYQNPPQQPGWNQSNYHQNPLYRPGLTKKEFNREIRKHKMMKELKASCIIAYIVVTISYFSVSSTYSLIEYKTDVTLPAWFDLLLFLAYAIYIALAVVVQNIQSRVAAILFGGYLMVNVVYSIMEYEKTGNWLIIVAAIGMIYYTFQYHTIWNEYCETGMLPAVAPKRKRR